MTDAPKLLPCPFCGGTKLSVFPPNCKEDDEYDPKDNAQPVVRCYTCFAEILGKTWDHDMKSAVTAWNTRADLIPAMLEAARREALEEAAKLIDDFRRDPAHAGLGCDAMISAIRALAVSPPTPTPVDGGLVGDLAVCDRCAGNGEIVTDWDAYLKPPAGAAGDHGTAECPDCSGCEQTTPTPADGENSGETVGKGCAA